MEKRYQVFVSSTYVDLKEERQVIIQTLLEMDCIPAGMELFPAVDEEQFEFIKHVIDDCDYYLIIIGGRYGSETSEGISYTEKEFDYAVEKNKKVIAFIPENPDEISVGKTDTDNEKKEKLNSFIAKLKLNRLVKTWKNISDLPGLVSINLNKTIKTFPACGWIRGTEKDTNEILIENFKLREEIRKLKENTYSDTIDIPDLVPMSDSYTIEFLYFNSDKKKQIETISTSWNELFSKLAPYTLDSPEDETIRKILCNFILEKLKNSKISQIFIDNKVLKEIKIQFMANNLIDQLGYSWDLTDKGRRLMLLLNAKRKQQPNI